VDQSESRGDLCPNHLAISVLLSFVYKSLSWELVPLVLPRVQAQLDSPEFRAGAHLMNDEG